MADLPANMGKQRPDDHAARTPETVGEHRHVFWENVLREMLTTLSVLSHNAPPAPPPELPAPGDADQAEANGEPGQAEETEQPEGAVPDLPAPPSPGTLFDGRLAVVTRLGQRIPIADVYPLFACSVRSSPESRSLSADVQCSVFQIRTPAGEVYTLPLHEITAFHALSAELIERLAAAARARESKAEQNQATPFGFAAFTSLARSQSPGGDQQARSKNPPESRSKT